MSRALYPITNDEGVLRDLLKGPASYKVTNPLIVSLCRRGLVRWRTKPLPRAKSQYRWYEITLEGRAALSSGSPTPTDAALEAVISGPAKAEQS